MIQYTYLPPLPWLAGGGLLIAAVIGVSYWSGRGRAGRGWRMSLAAVRWVVIAAIVFCLLDPEWIEAIKHQQRSRLAVLLDTSRSMALKDLPRQRLALAKTWLQRNLAPAAPPDFDLTCYGFNDSLVPLKELEAAKAEGEGTGLADALDSLLAVPGDDPLTGVVVCSDGNENLRHDLDSVARSFRRKGIPVHTLTIGTTNDMRDVILENVQVKRTVPNRAPTKVGITLRAPGFVSRTVPVQIVQNDQVLAVEDVHLTGGSQKVELELTPRQKGFQVYEARIPAQEGEWLTTNNRRLFALDVTDSMIRVLYMEGTPQQPTSPIPEWKYLKSALESDPNIKVTTLYRAFGAKGKHLNTIDVDPETGERIYPVEHPTKGFPQTLPELLQYDVIIHSDIRKESFTAEQLQNIARLVEEFGGGFIMIGGNSAFGKGGYHRTILDRIIPVAMHQQNDSEARPFHLHVPAAAWSHPIIAIGQTREETELIWTRKFPVLYGCNIVDRAKPGAIVLGDDPLNRGATGPRLVVAVQNVGKGRSMAFTSDTTRTWGKDFETLWGEPINPALPLTEANCDSRYYRQFWVNAVRWLAAGRAGRTNSAVSLDLAQTTCAPREKVRVSIGVKDKNLRDLPTARVTVTLAAAGHPNTSVQATYNNLERHYEADLTPPEAGTYLVTARASVRSSQIGEDQQLLVCEGADRELADVRAKPDLMERLAQITGGKVLTVSESPSALSKSVFYKAPPITVEYRHNPLWDKSWWLALVLGLLGSEWAVRRAKGLA